MNLLFFGVAFGEVRSSASSLLESVIPVVFSSCSSVSPTPSSCSRCSRSDAVRGGLLAERAAFGVQVALSARPPEPEALELRRAFTERSGDWSTAEAGFR